jgi:hypothetical protein
VRTCVLRAAARRGLLERAEAQAMGAWAHGGGPSLWQMADAGPGETHRPASPFDPPAQSAPDDELDQRIAW